MEQWRSQNRVVAWAQAGQHIRCCASCGKLACGSTLFYGICRHAPPHRKILEFRTSEIASAGFSGQVSVAKIIPIFSIQKALLFYSPSSLFRSPVDSSAHGANLKLRQANARAQAKVARARARVCRGLATPLVL